MGGGYNNPNSRPNPVKQKKTVREGDTFKVVGTLVDSTTGEQLPFVNLALLDSKDSSLVKGGVTDLGGRFEIGEVPVGNFLLRISAIGYRTTFLPLAVSNNTAMGTIKMKPGAASLDAVTITAERPLYAMDGEKLVYNVGDDPSIQTGTTTDALQNAPGVEVDIEGNVTLRGVSSVEIWINDKPSRLTEENLKTYLENLPANALERIETITNPSAKYATEAEAVINIVTTAHVKSNQFFSFGLNAASQPNVSPWASYTWANERLTINAFASGRFSRRESIGDSWQCYLKDNADTTGLDTIMYQQDSSATATRNFGANLGFNISYEIDTMSDISFWSHLSHNNNTSDNTGWSLRDQRDNLGQSTLFEYNYNNNTHNKTLFGMFGGDYSKKFDKNGHNLRLSMYGNFNNSTNTMSRDRVFSQTDGSMGNTTFYKYQDVPKMNSSLSLSARYNRPYSKDGEMSYGMSYNHNATNNDNNYYVLDTTYHTGIVLDETLYDTLRRYTFAENRNSINGDANWTHRWGGFTLTAGFGANLSTDHFTYDNTIFPDDTTYLWLTVNPSVHASYRTKDMHNFKVNYSLRMRNPNEMNLTKHRTYTEDSYSVGNRNVRQSYTHNAELGWTKFFERFGNVSLETYYRLSTGEIDDLADVTDDIDTYIGRIINYTTPYNIGSSWRYGASANMTYRPSGFLNVRLYANLYDYGYSMQYEKLGETVRRDQWSYSIRLNMWAKVMNKYQIHASANYTSPTIGLMSTRSARYFVNCGVRADFFKRKLSAYINVQDIFNWGRKIGSGNGNTNPYFMSSNNSFTTNSRFISAGLTFRFGKMELERSSRSGSEETGPNSALPSE